jgi:hypothetical protein
MAKAKRDAKPTDPSLLIDCEGVELSAENATAVDEYHRDCVEWEQQRDNLLAGRQALADGATEATLGDILEHGGEFETWKRNLEKERAALGWEKMDLLARLIPDFERAAANAKAELEKTEQEQCEKFADALLGMRAGDTPAGRIQLLHRVRKELPVMAAEGRRNQADVRLAAIKHNAFIPPTKKQCKIEWPLTSNAVFETLMGHVSPVIDEGYSEAELAVLELTGLKNAPLLDETKKTVRAVVAALRIPAGGTGWVIKFRNLNQAVAAQIGPLLERLPATVARNAALTDLQNYTRPQNEPIDPVGIRHRNNDPADMPIRGDAKFRTYYCQIKRDEPLNQELIDSLSNK